MDSEFERANVAEAALRPPDNCQAWEDEPWTKQMFEDMLTAMTLAWVKEAIARQVRETGFSPRGIVLGCYQIGSILGKLVMIERPKSGPRPAGAAKGTLHGVEIHAKIGYPYWFEVLA